MGRGGYPFERYPVAPAAVEGAGQEILGCTATFKGIGDHPYTQELIAEVNSEGLLEGFFGFQGSAIQRDCDWLSEAAVVGGGACNRWAQGITDYDVGVAGLNAEYATARASNFGVTGDFDSRWAQEHPERAQQRYDDARADAEAALLADLRQRLARLETDLDGVAATVAGMLDQDPSEETILALFEAGALPMAIPALLPGIDFSGVDIRVMLNTLSRYGDLPPGVDPAAVGRELDAIDGVLNQGDFGSNGNGDDLQRMWEQLRGLDPAAVDFVVLGLSDDELSRLDDLVSNTDDSGWKWWDHNGLDHWDRIDFHSLFLAGGSAETLRRLQNNWSSIEPSFADVDDADDLSWGRPNGELWPTDEDGRPMVTSDQLSQGGLGDCWFLASLTGAAQHDSDFVPDHLGQNANGTVSVTLYDDDGNPQRVTVTPDLPLDSSGNPAFAHGTSGELWPAYYEKAFALAYTGDSPEGTYQGIVADDPGDAAPYLSGYGSDGVDVDYDDVRDTCESGHPVVVSTKDKEDDVPEDQRAAYHTNHAYYVKGFEDGEIVLGNPWGPDYPEIRMSPEEFEEAFDGADAHTLGD